MKVMDSYGNEHDFYLWMSVDGIFAIRCRAHEHQSRNLSDRLHGTVNSQLPVICGKFAAQNLVPIMRVLFLGNEPYAASGNDTEAKYLRNVAAKVGMTTPDGIALLRVASSVEYLRSELQNVAQTLTNVREEWSRHGEMAAKAKLQATIDAYTIEPQEVTA